MELIIGFTVLGIGAFFGFKISRWFLRKLFVKTKEYATTVEDGYRNVRDTIQDKRMEYADVELDRLKKENEILQKKQQINSMKSRIKNNKSQADLERDENYRKQSLKEKLLDSLKM